MPDLLEPADASGRDREVVSSQLSIVSGQSAAVRDPDSSRLTTDDGQRIPVLLFDRVSKWYGPVIGVNQVTLELRPGITGLVGANGSGKSTLLRLAGGHIRADLGTVRVSGHKATSAQARLHVGYCPEHDMFYEEMSGRRFVQTMARLCGFPRPEARRRTDQTLALVGMDDRADRPIGGYSKGMRQRIKLAQALIHDPELLLLDEPLSGIDPIGRRESIALFLELARRGKCLLISSHELEELEKLTDHVAIMARGRIAAVGPLPHIRALLDDHPLSIRVASDQNRRLAASLLELDEVVGVDVESEDYLIVRARNPRRFFHHLSGLVLDENLAIRHLETVDESTHAVLGYLLGGSRGRNDKGNGKQVTA
jgi:ABC-2 type transport system ATP-binding protein